ncbi:MAG: hypothetical protein K1X64_00100 [Myxococcaceae bacterium]|nr:hypothetical protein [Myxococcaceae bacterium]
MATVKRHSASITPQPLHGLLLGDTAHVETAAKQKASTRLTAKIPWGGRVSEDRRGLTPLSLQFIALWDPVHASPTLAGSVHEVLNWVDKVTARTALDGVWLMAANLQRKSGMAGAMSEIALVAPGDRVTLEELKPMVTAFQKLRGLERAVVGEAMLRNDIEGRATPQALKLLKAAVLPEVTGRAWEERILLRDFAFRVYSLTHEVAGEFSDAAGDLPVKTIKARTLALLNGFHEVMSKGEDPLARNWNNPQ